ncbi:MAG: O-acetylhomoserine aminocarboxypropyltransferase/cysteine synthase, partial [Campylobacteraceae bacterium]|nr:O-acetylhomoserine aminocarboxypropyltransferase/cysteine synthase [Campylobacteraceae bacterium]
ASIAPFNAWQFIQGLETLAIRMRAISDSALKVATYLSENENVKLILYPGLKTDPSHEKLCKYFNSTLSSGLIHLELKDENLAKELVDKTKLFSVVVNIGDSKSLITHPASTTHQQLSNEALNEQGISPKVVRLSIGLEDPQDLIEDLKNILG